MPKENVYVVAKEDEQYKFFINLVRERFTGLKTVQSEDILFKHFMNRGIDASSIGNNLLILFVESSFINKITKFLNSTLPESNYILVAFYSKVCSGISNYKNIFDLVDINSESFNPEFFMSKLETEIHNKSRTLLLQFEVKNFYEIGKSLSTEKDTMKLFEMIVDSSLSLTSSDAGTIYLVVDKKSGSWSAIKNNMYEDKQLKFVIARNSSIATKLEASTSEISKESIFGCTSITGKALRIDDAYSIDDKSDYKHDKSYDKATGYITKSILSIPMKDHENNVTGVIQLINKKKTKGERLDFSDKAVLSNIISYDYTDELIMNSLAGQAAIALENNLLYRDMNSLLQSYKEQNSQLEFLTRKILRAHEEERKRIAREIHDGPAQSVVNLSLKLELCKKYLSTNNLEKLSDELNSFNSSARAVTKEIRTIIYNLKPSYLEDGLVKALENHFNIFTENTGIEVDFSVSGDDSIIEYYMTSTLYRIVQEAFNNILKHADALKVTVRLKIDGEAILLTIIDNGKGFNTATLKQRSSKRIEGGFGLEGIKERLELISGSLNIKSKPGQGTKLTISVPLV